MIVIKNKKQYDKFTDGILANKKTGTKYSAKIGKMTLSIEITDMGEGPYMYEFYHWYVEMKLLCGEFKVDEKFSFFSDENENLMADDIFWNYEELLEIKNAGDNGKSNS